MLDISVAYLFLSITYCYKAHVCQSPPPSQEELLWGLNIRGVGTSLKWDGAQSEREVGHCIIVSSSLIGQFVLWRESRLEVALLC